jgi:hypothetical protein
VINKKIKADLQARGRSAPNMEAKILSILNSAPDQVFTLRDICNKNGQHNGAFWAAAYHLASKGLIGFADRKYHVWSVSKLATYSMRIRTVVWHKDLEIENVILREQWVDLVPVQVQAPLFAGDITTLSNEDLNSLMQRVQKERFERLLKARYSGGDVNTCAPVVEALRGVGIADPVAYMHSDQSCTFVTMTCTKEMPIKITIKSKDKEARTIDNIEHITLHGLPVVATLKSAFEGGD